MHKNTRALVLREVKYKDADKILTVLTEDEGKITVKARGAYRKSCRYGAATQCFTFSEMNLFFNSGRYSLNEASIIEQFLPLREDFEAMALASYFAGVMESVSDEDKVTPEVLQLGLNSLFALSKKLYSHRHIKSAFELRLMCLSGFEPDVCGCTACGKERAERPMLSLSGGGVHCAACPPGVAGKSVSLCEGSLLAMRHVVSAGAKNIFSFSISEDAELRLSAACEEYMTEQLGHRFRALDYYNNIRTG